jgi:hypothetical protein
LLLSFLLVSSKPKPNLKKLSSTQKKQTIKEIGKKFHPKEYYDDLVEKGLKADNLTRGHPPYPFYEKMNFTEDKKTKTRYNSQFQKKGDQEKISQRSSNLRKSRLYEFSPR